MNNKKILVVGILAVIVTMMVGYALFSETITINGTATAKGDFEFTATCSAGIPNDILTALGLTSEDINPEVGYSNDTCTVNGNTVSYSADLKYPGAGRYFTIKLKNTGSISAYFDDATGTTELKICTDENGDNVTENCETLNAEALIVDLLGFIKEDGTIVEAGSEEFYPDAADSAVLKSDQSAILVGYLNWDSSMSTETYNNKLFKIEATSTFDMKQYND